MKAFGTTTFVLLLPLLNSCVSTELNLANHTGAGVYVYSGHTKKVTTVSPGARTTVPHSSGKLIVITKRDDVWEYDNVQSVVDEAHRKFKRISLDANLESDGSITFPSGRILKPTRTMARSEK